MISQADLFAKLTELNISTTTVSHPPLFSVADSQALRGKISGVHTKNLFLKDKKGNIILLVAEESTQINLKTIHKRMGTQRLSFGKPELLMDVLGMQPGSVNPFALINDTQKRCSVWLNQTLLAYAQINFHPLINTQTTTLASADLIRFLEHIDHSPHFIDLSNSGQATT